MRQILRASALMASSSVVVIVAGIARQKAIALLLGPAGMGLYGVLQSIQATASTVAGLGLSTSGVRQVAAANSEGNSERLAANREAMRLCALASGLVCAAAIFVFRRELARLCIGDARFASTVGALGIGVLATSVSGAQLAWLNGLGRLRELAKANAVGALISVPLSVGVVWRWGERGLGAAVIASAAGALLASWLYARRARMGGSTVRWAELGRTLPPLLRIGIAFMLTTLLTTLSQAVVRVLVSRQAGLAATGHFQAAWSISMLYIGFVLSAMSTDYYPRLTSCAMDREQMRNTLREQTNVAMLLAGPVILGMVALGPLVVRVLYSSDFADTVDLLRWQMVGDVLKVSSWPLAYVLLARAASMHFFAAEALWNLLYVALVWLGLPSFGVEVTGLAFMLAYAVYYIIVTALVRAEANIGITISSLKLQGCFLACAALLVALHRTRTPGALPLSVGVWLGATAYALRRLQAGAGLVGPLSIIHRRGA